MRKVKNSRNKKNLYHKITKQKCSSPAIVRKSILKFLELALLGYGIYTQVAPEASVRIGGMSVEAQDNTDSYMTIGLGILALGVSFLGKRDG